ncbi:MAG: GNAT family protein [Candidatus Bathyarchaeia archaeon]|jgi:RimJ/RimL family protein N-acetyltransferase
MKAGRIIRTFSAKDGREVVLRTPTWNDLDDLLALINSLVEERADILIDEKLSRDEEINWLSKTLARLEKDETFHLVAEVNGKAVGSAEFGRKTSGYDKHVGMLGIVIGNGYRDLRIGTEIMKSLIEQARAVGLKLLTLSVYATNERARHVYQKLGFVETGRIPKKFFKDGKYVDEITMAKVLE